MAITFPNGHVLPTGIEDVPDGVWTAVDLAERFGPIPLNRICHDALPGTATEEDVIAWQSRSNRLFELIDGVLLEKTMSSYEPRRKSAQVYEGRTSAREVTVTEMLESRVALPEFALSLQELFADPSQG